MQSPSINGKATGTKSTFKRVCSVTTNIRATPEAIWSILTNAAAITKWNSTILSFEGRIALNEKITLKSIADPKRTFNLKITEFNAPRKMVWSAGAAPMFTGIRTYTLTPNADGTTEFSMSEVIAGLLLPILGASLPDFGPMFEQFAADLKREAEKV